MKPNQPQLPTMPRDFTEPQIIARGELPRLITEAASAGFEAVRLECWERPFGYRATFQPMPDASESRNARPAQMMDGCPPEKSGHLPFEPIEARNSCIPASFYAPIFQ
jgi:hypothetical protein